MSSPSASAIAGRVDAPVPVVAADDFAYCRIDTDAILFVKTVGGGGVAYPTGQEGPIAPATWAAILNTLPVALFRAAPAVLADGQGTALRCDANGRLLITTIDTPPSRYNSGGDVASQLISAGVRSLQQVLGFNAEAGNLFFQMFDAIALPANGTLPIWPGVLVPPGTNFGVTWEEGLPFATGIFWAASTTRTTLTVTLGAGMSMGGVFR